MAYTRNSGDHIALLEKVEFRSENIGMILVIFPKINGSGETYDKNLVFANELVHLSLYKRERMQQ